MLGYLPWRFCFLCPWNGGLEERGGRIWLEGVCFLLHPLLLTVYADTIWLQNNKTRQLCWTGKYIGTRCRYYSHQTSSKDLRKRSALAVNCWVIIHCLEVSCKEDQITSAQREWFILVQPTDKQWIITQQFAYWSWSISILIHNKRRKHIWSLQLLSAFRHCTEELPPILRLRRIRLHVNATSFKRKNDDTPSNAMNDVIFQWRQLSHT